MNYKNGVRNVIHAPSHVIKRHAPTEEVNKCHINQLKNTQKNHTFNKQVAP